MNDIDFKEKYKKLIAENIPIIQMELYDNSDIPFAKVPLKSLKENKSIKTQEEIEGSKIVKSSKSLTKILSKHL